MIRKIREVSWLILALLLLPAWSWAATLKDSSGDVTWVYDTDTKTLTVKPTKAGAKSCSTENFHGTWWYPSDGQSKAKNDYSGSNPFAKSRGYQTKCTGDLWGAEYEYDCTKSVTIADEATTIIVEEGVTEIGAAFFYGMSNVTSVTLPNSLTTISYEAFRLCSSLTSLTLGPKVCTIRDRWITDCPSLTTINLSEDNICFKLDDKYGALYTADGKTLVRVPEGRYLLEIFIAEGCDKTATDALYQVNTLTTITLPSTLTTVEYGVLDGMENLKEIYFKSESAPTFEKKIGNGTDAENLSLWIPCIPEDAERAGDYSKVTGVKLSAISGWLSDIVIEACVTNQDMGAATVVTKATCDNKNAVIKAVAHNGYRFLYWRRASDDAKIFENPYTFAVEKSETFYAYFAKDNFGVTVMVEDTKTDSTEKGKVKGTGTCVYGNDTTIFAIPSACYEFEKWNDGVTDATRTVTVTQDTTFQAYFKKKEFTASVSVNNAKMGSATLSSETVYCGDNVKVTATPAVNHHFLYWTTAAAEKITTESFDTVAGGNMKFIANFAIDSFEVRFLDYDGKLLCKDTLAYGETPSCDEPTRAKTDSFKYEFTGWNPEVSAVTKAQDYVAKYDSMGVEYKLHVWVDGAKSDVTYKYGTEVIAPTDPAEKIGHQFNGWKDENGNIVTFGFNMPAKDTTVYANFTKNQYHVVFKDGLGGTTIKDTLYTFEDEVIEAKPLIYACYDFDGWFDEAGSAVAFGFAMPAHDTTIVANYSVRKHTISYYDRNNNLIGNKKFGHDCGSTVAKQDTTPEEKGYTFKHWSETPNGTEVNFGFRMPDDDIVLYSVWEVNTYTLTLNANGGAFVPGGETVKTSSKNFGVNVTKPVDGLSRTGYEFAGWAADVKGSTMVTFPFAMDDKDTTLYAVWTINQYTLTFNTDGGSAIDPIKQDYNSAVTAPADPTKDCYTFMGWNDAAGNKTEIPAIMPAENMTFIADWDIIKKSVTFMSDGNAVSTKTGVECGSTVNAPADPTKVGYTFGGWATDAAGKNVAMVPFTMGSNDTTLYAVWTINQYTLTFNTVGGSEIAPITQDYNSAVTAPADPTKDCYTFMGWNDADGNEAEIPTIMPAQNMTFTADWDIIKKSVTFMSDGNAVSTETGVECGSTVNAPAEPTKEGYTFAGWTTDEDGTNAATLPFTMGGNDTTFYAAWTINSYTLTFNTNGGSEILPITQEYNSSITAPANPTKTGYTFNGWKDAEGNDVVIPATMPAKDSTIYAAWTINSYTLTFNTNGGSEILPITQEYNSSITAPANPTKTGYTFNGWKDAEGNDVVIPAAMPAKDSTIYAAWTINSYALTFINEGDEYKKIVSDYGSSVTAPADPTTLECKNFIGWYDANDAKASKLDVPTIMPAENMTFYAHWENKEFTAKFTVGETVISESKVRVGDKVTAPEAPDSLGHSFSSWFVGDYKPNFSIYVFPCSDVNFYAGYTKNQYTLTFRNFDGTVLSKVTVKYGADLSGVARPDAKKTGNTFKGWSPEIPETMPAHDLTVTAQFDVESYTLKLIDWDDKVFGERSYNYESVVPAPDKNPTREGYTFSKWVDADGDEVSFDFQMPAKDTIVYASYTKNKYVVTFIKSDKDTISSDSLYFEAEIVAPTPDSVGYTFTGWSPAVDATVPAKNVTYTAQWQINTHTIVFKDSSCTRIIKEITAEYGTPIVPPTAEETALECCHYFIGWNGYVPATMPDEEMTFCAMYQPNRHNVTFEHSTGRPHSESRAYGETVKKFVIDPRGPMGYTFAGWFSKTGEPAEFPFIMPDHDTTFVDSFTVNQYSVTFIDCNASTDTIKSYVADYGSPLVRPTEEELYKEGYTFTGWRYLPETVEPLNSAYCAKYKINKYAVIYKDYDGKELTRDSFEFNSKVDQNSLRPYREGYAFVGWEDANSKAVAFDFNMPAKDTVVYATYNILSSTVIFRDCDDVTNVIKEIVADYGTAIDLPTPAEYAKEGYTFLGWDRTVPTTMPADDMWICANYQINKYAVIYQDYNGKELYRDSVIYNQVAVNRHDNPTRVGHTFTGWKDANGSEVTFDFTMPAKDTTVKASYSVNSYNIAFVACQSNDTIKKFTGNFGSRLEAPTAVELYKEGYTFKGWDEPVPSTVPDRDTTFCANYNVNVYAVYYEDYDGKELLRDSVAYSSRVLEPTDKPTREGYTFTGWVDENGTAVEYAFVMPAKDSTIKASYSVEQFHVTFYDADSTTIIKDVYADYGTVVVPPADPAKEGHEFTGWGVDEVPAKVIAKDTNLYANYKVLDYTITFKNYNDTVLAAYTLPYGTRVMNVPHVPARTGYTFKGWQELVPVIVPAKNVVCKAQFKIDQYTVFFYNADSSLIVRTRGDYGNALQVPSDEMVKKVDGYSFVGWSEELPATIPACDTAFYAVLERNAYIITFQDYDKTVIQRDTLLFDESINVPTVAAREGYTFAGWDKTVPATVPSSNQTFTAKYTINKHSVVFEDFDGTVLSQQTVTYGENIIEPTASRTGYTFTGWDKEIPASMPDSSLLFVAQYKVNAYVITYNDYDGSKFAADTIDFGMPIVAKEGPARVGYTFEAWSPVLPDTMPANNITVVAQYKLNSHILTFKYYDEKENLVSTKNLVGYGNAITAPTLSKRTGYTFIGWEAEVPATMPDSDLVCVAQYQINKYNIVYKEKDDSKTYFADSLEYGATINVPTPETREGLSFAGWDVALVTVPAVNVTIYALWDTVTYEFACKDYNDTVLYSDSLKYGAEVVVPVTPAREGYTFAGWEPEQPNTMPAGDLVLIAQYTVNRHELVFEDEEGNELKRDTLDFGEKIVPPADPEKEGYDFNGWIDLPETMVDEDIVVRPDWKEQDLVFTIEDMEALTSRHCEGEDVRVYYNYTSGKPLSYKFYFSDEAVEAGFPAEQSGELGEDGELYLSIPMGVELGEYGVELQLFGNEKESAKAAFTISTHFSSARLVKMWDDVVVCNNADNMFVSYQWYKDGEEIAGATDQYYCELGGLDGDYSVKVVTADGDELFVCKKHFDRVEPPFSIAVYPNPAKANENFTLEVKGLTEEEFASARIFVYAANGVIAYSTKKVSNRNSLSLPIGEYVALVVLEGRSAYCKVLVR